MIDKINTRARSAQSDGLHPVSLDEWVKWCDAMNEGHSEALHMPNAAKPEHVIQRKPGSDTVFFMAKVEGEERHVLRKVHYRTLGTEGYILQNGDAARAWFRGCGMSEATIDKLAKRIRWVAVAKDKEARQRMGPITPEEETRCIAYLRSIGIDLSTMAPTGRHVMAGQN